MGIGLLGIKGVTAPLLDRILDFNRTTRPPVFGRIGLTVNPPFSGLRAFIPTEGITITRNHVYQIAPNF